MRAPWDVQEEQHVKTLRMLAIVLVTAGLATAAAPSADDLMKELTDPKAPVRTADELQPAYDAVVAELSKPFAGEDPKGWASTDTKLEMLCHFSAAPGKEPYRMAAVRALIKQLEVKHSTPGLHRVIRHIERIGGEEAVDTLAALLTNEGLREQARRALTRNPSERAVAALRAALPMATDKAFRIGLINSLGYRKDVASLKPLLALAADADEETRVRASEALARLGDPSAAKVIRAAIGRGTGHLKIRATESLLRLADTLTTKGKQDEALAIYRSMLGEASYIKCATIVGIGRAGGAKDVDTLVGALAGSDKERAAVGDALVYLKDPKASAAIAAELSAASAKDKVILLTAMGRRGDATVLEAVLAAAKDADETVRIAAYEALGRLKAPGAVATLVAALKTARDAERDKAEWALGRVPGSDVTKALIAALPGTAGETRAVLFRALGQRRDAAALPQLVAGTKDADEAVRVAAFRAIGHVGSVKGLPVVFRALQDTEGATREAAIYALRRTHGQQATAAITAAAKGASPKVLGPIIEVLSWRKDPAVTAMLLAGAKHADAAVRVAAIEGLARSQDPAAVPILIAAATAEPSPVRDAAVRTSLVFMNAIVKADPKAAVTIATLGLDLKIVKHRDDRRLAIRGLGQAAGPEAVDMLCNLFRDRSLNGEAHSAIFNIGKRLLAAKKNEEAKRVYLTLMRRSNDARHTAEAQRELTKLGFEGDMPALAGFLTRWHVCGAFPNPKNVLFSKVQPPEQGPVDLAKPVTINGVSRPWQSFQTKDPAGIVKLQDITRERDNVAAFMYAEFTAPEAADIRLKLGYGEGCVAILNGKKVHSRSGSRLSIDDQRVKASLVKGRNTLLLKVVRLAGRSDWAACVRITTVDNQYIPITQE
jgi:HEAT repeat protein